MKFKVGDRVRCIDASDSRNGELEEGKIYIISQVDEEDGYVKLQGLSDYDYDPSRFEKIEYTYEDLKKSPIGTKIKFENGETLVKDSAGLFESDGYVRSIEELKKFETRLLGKIIKIEEPEYTTVYEAKVEILDEVEKRYLRGVIRPFRDKVKYIVLKSLCSNEAYILIKLENDVINLPVFEINTMYKNMEKYKEYTLEELGL